MPCPGCKDVDLTTSLQQLKDQQVTMILTLMSEAELAQYGVASLPQQCSDLAIQWLHFPIDDGSTPAAADQARWQELKAIIVKGIQQGQTAAVHCKGGSGRAGLCTAMLLVDLGYPVDEAMAMVQAVRPTALSKATQVAYLQRYADADSAYA